MLGINQQGRASSFLNMLYWFGVDQLGRACLWRRVPSALGMASLLIRLYQFGVVGLCMLGVNQQGRDSSFLNTLHWFGVVGLCTLRANQQGRASSFLNMLYWFGVDQLGRACLWRVPSALGMASLLNRLYQFGVVGLCTPGINQQGRDSSFLNTLHWFGVVGLCTLGINQQGRASSFLNRLYCVWCSRALYTWAQLVKQGGLFISQQVILHWCSRTLHLGSISRGGPPHFSICYTGLVQQGSVHLGSISRGAIYFSIGHTTLVQQGSTLGVNQQGRASSFLNRLYYMFGVVGLCTLGLNQQDRASSFLNRLSLKLWCSRALYTWGPLVGEGLLISQSVILIFCVVGLCILGVDQQERASSFLNRFYWFAVVGLCTLGLNQQVGLLISQSVILIWYSRDLYTQG